MNIRNKLKSWKERRAFAQAKRRFVEIVAASPFNRMTRRERRQYFKELLREVGYKEIRIQERKRLDSRLKTKEKGQAVFDAVNKVGS